jgi:uncharacterized protein (DUF1697 family)
LAVYIALLRAIGPSTHARMSMAALREACGTAGFWRVSTYIATGNVIFESEDPEAVVQGRMNDIMRSFGLDNPVLLRRPEMLRALLAQDTFPEATAGRPDRVAICFLAATPAPERLAALLAYPGPERIMPVDGEVCVDYPDGIGRSKLAPPIIERRLRVVGTARNWNTVRALVELAKGHEHGTPRP